MPQKRVLFVNDTARNGGPGRTLFTLLKHFDPALVHRAVVLPRPGVVSELLSSDGVCDELEYEPGIVENPLAPLGREMTREDFDAPAALKGARAVANVGLGTAGALRIAARARRHDAIFCNGTTANFFGAIASRLTGVPAVWHVFYPEVPSALRPAHEALARSPGVKKILCVSKPVMKQFERCCPEKLVHMHDAIDEDDFAPGAARAVLRAELGIAPEVPVFGSQGRILRRKGYVELVQATRLVSEDLRVVVLGDTPQDMPVDHLAECRALARELGVEERVLFLGYRPDVRPYVEDFDCAVVPSVYPDPLPRSVLESMALAKPVIAFDVGGIGEMVEHEVTGLLVRAGDVPGLARAMDQLARDQVARLRMGRAARERVIGAHGARAHANAVQEILLSL